MIKNHRGFFYNVKYGRILKGGEKILANNDLRHAKRNKNDEFYTQYSDIQKEINAYLEYDPDAFRGKTVLLPCDDPEWSNFTKFFAQNFEMFGLKKLISTSYAAYSKKYVYQQLSLFETESPKYDPSKTNSNGKVFILERDINNSGYIDREKIKRLRENFFSEAR